MNVDGVVSADVSFDDARAEVRYLPDVVQPPALVTAVEEAGFGAEVIDEGPEL